MKFHFMGHIPCRISRNALLLTGILVLGAALRFNNVTQPFTDSFNWRQTSTAMMASNFYHKSWNIFYPEVNWTATSPGYQGREFQTVGYIAALLYLAAGEHDWIGRGVAVLFGLWGIFALYQLVRRVWDEEHALLSAAVMAVLPGSIFIERSFLPDPGMVALMTTSIWMLVAYLQTDRLRFLLLAGVIGAWGVLTKLPGLVVSFAMLYATLTTLRHRHELDRRKIAVIGIVAALALIPVALYYLWAVHLGRSYPPYHIAGEGNWIWNQGLKQWLDQDYFFPRLSRHFNNWLWTEPIIILVVLGIVFPFFGFARWERSQNSVSGRVTAGGSVKAPWLFHWWLLGMLPYYLIGAQELVDNPWNFHIIDPAAAALSSYAIITISSLIAKMVRPSAEVLVKQGIIAASLILIGVLGTMRLKRVYYPAAKNDYELGLALRQVSQPHDLVVTMATVLGDPIVIYYSHRRGWLFPPPSPSRDFIELPEDDGESIRAFEELRTEGARWFGIVAAQHKKLQQKHPLLLAHFERTSHLYRCDPRWRIYFIIPGDKKN